MTASFSPAKGRESLHYSLSSALSVIFHLGIVALLIVTFVDETPVKVPPAAIMLSFAEQIQVSQPKAILPLGVNQQQKAEASAAEQTPEREEVARILAAESGEFAEKKPQKITKVAPKQIDAKKHNTLKQQAIQGNATLTSRAAPQPMEKAADKTAAPVQSDARSVKQAQLSWEGLVKGKLNSVKRYPADARRRGREGIASVTFLVDAQGNILSSEIVKSSETLALDRESLAMLKRAEPLPAPPETLLVSGRTRVTMPINFDLTQAH